MALQLVTTALEGVRYYPRDTGERRVSTGDVEQKIVNHLKRKLNSRIDRRLRHLSAAEELKEARQDREERRQTATSEKKAPRKQHGDTTKPRGGGIRDDKIFSRYDEFGQKLQIPSMRNAGNHVGGAWTPESHAGGGLESADEAGKLTARPINGHANSSTLGRTAVATVLEAGEDEDIDVELMSVWQKEVAAEKLADDRVAQRDAPLPLSPVITPHIGLRPGTRQQARPLSHHGGFRAVLQGDMSVSCPGDMRVARLYVSTAGTDTRVEQKHFVQSLYPRLKALCSLFSCELQILDMHWGMSEACIDNHSYANSCLQALSSCRLTKGSTFVAFTSGKYGDCCLPATLPVEEYRAIYTSLARAHKAIKDEIAAVRQRLKAEEEAERATNSQKSLGQQLAEEVEAANNKAPITMLQKVRLAGRMVILASASKEKDSDALKPSTLESWYKLDDNCVPAVYRLQRVSTQFPDFVKADASRRKAAQAGWLEISQRLLGALQKHSPRLSSEQKGDSQSTHLASLLDLEIQSGMLARHSDRGTVVWFSKQFDGMEEKDVVSENFTERRQDVRRKLKRLEEAIHSCTPAPTSMNETVLEWTADGFAPESLRSHQLYLEKLNSQLVSVVHNSLHPHFQEETAMLPTDHFVRALYTEVVQHTAFCQERAWHFHGRKALLVDVKRYIQSKSRAPLLLHGRPGNGRKSFICRVAKECQKWCRNGVSVLFRTCGLSGESSNVRSLLYSLCTQLCAIFGGHDCSVIPTDFKGLINDFADRIKLANAEQTLVIIIDSLENLSDENDAMKLNWLPKELPSHVRMILSTLSDEKVGTLDAMKKIWSDQKQNFIELGDMPIEDALPIFSHWMKAAGRKLTDAQQTAVVDAYRQSPSPLFLKAVYHECLSWPSYASPEQFKLPAGVKRVASVMLGRLERDHGDAVVRRALGYLTAARKGVTRNELEDLLSLDEPVMDELTSHLHLPLRRCPPAIVLRLVQDMGATYVVERTADSRRTIQWAHAQFREVAAERYLLQRDKAPSYHKALAEYFMGRWSDGEKKPIGNTEETAERFVASQKLCFSSPYTESGSFEPVYNVRKLNELPYHLINSQQFDVLKSECLCNYEWMLAKLCGCSFRALFDDYQLALTIEPKDKDLNLLLETLVLSREVLERDPRQLGSQLVGRITSLIQRDVPVAPQDPRQYPACHPLMRQVERSSVPTFVPSITCLTPPGGALADVLLGHQDELTAMTIASDGMRAVTASCDNTIKTWDLRSGKVSKTVANVGKDVMEIILAANDEVAITSETRFIRIWDLELGVCKQTISDFHDYATLSVTKDGKTLVAYFVGENMMKSWNVDGPFTLLKVCPLEQRSSSDREKSILVSKTSVGDLVLIAYQDASHANTQNVKTGAIVHTLKCAEESARIVALAISNDYYILANRFRLLKREEPFALDLFNIQSGFLVRSVRGCCEDNISSIEVNASGSHAICLSTSRQTWCTDLAVWNLETEEHKHLCSHAGLGTLITISDLRYVVTACRGERSARVWNISGAIIKPAAKAKQTSGVAALKPMQDHPRYVVVASTDNGQLSVWNVAKGKSASGAPVQIEHGLVEPHDVVVIRNTKALILGDRGISPVSKESIFQTVYLYDLRTRTYERKVTGMYVIPSQPHEYALLSDDYLLGLSENRSHFIVWNIPQGVLSHRIKPSFVTKPETSNQLHTAAAALSKKRNMTAKMTPWDRRAETESARNGRRGIQLEQELRKFEERKKEKENGVEQFIISANEKIIVASYFAHHLCVFDVERRDHVQTLEDDCSVLHLYVAALTHDGSSLVHANYNEDHKVSYVTLWDCFGGEVRKRLKNEKDVRALGISEDGQRVVIGKGKNELRVWHPMEHASVKKLKPYPGFRFLPNGNKVFMLRNGTIALIYAGDISAWDLEAGVSVAVYTPDTRITSIATALDGRVLCFGLCDSVGAVALRLMSRTAFVEDDAGSNIFGEVPEDSDSD